MLQRCAASRDAAADFFLERKASDSVERLWLLREGLAWLKGERHATIDSQHNKDNTDENPKLVKQRRKRIHQLEMRVLLEAGSADGSGGDSGGGGGALDELIGTLLLSDDVERAEALCRQHGYESPDIPLVQAARALTQLNNTHNDAASALTLPPAAAKAIDTHNARAQLLLSTQASKEPNNNDNNNNNNNNNNSSNDIANNNNDNDNINDMVLNDSDQQDDRALQRAFDSAAHRAMAIGTVLAVRERLTIDTSDRSQCSAAIGVIGQACVAASARLACARARVLLDAADALGTTVDSLSNQSPHRVLRSLVMKGRSQL